MKQNNKLILNLIKDKKYFSINNNINENKNNISNTNLFIIIADIITGIISKIDKIEIFEEKEKQEVYDIVYNYYINDINIDYDNEKDLEHICILIVQLFKSINKKNKDELYENTMKLFLEKNKKSYYLIKQIYDMDMNDEINLKKKIIKNMVNNIEINDDAKNILIELLSLEKTEDKKIELLKDLNQELENIIISHITDNNYNSFMENIILILDNNCILNIIEYIINTMFKNGNSHIKELSEKLKKILKIYFMKIKDKNNNNNNAQKIEEIYIKVKKIYDQCENENKNYVLPCIKKLFKYCTLEYRIKYINEVILYKFEDNDKDINNNKIFNDMNNEPYIALLINHLLKNYEFFLEQNIIKNGFDDILITKIFDEINAMESIHKKVFETSKLFKIKNLSEKIKDKLLINFKKYYSSKNNVNNQFLNLLMNLYNSISQEEKEKNLDILFTLNIESINKKINPIQSIHNLKNILITMKQKEINKLYDLMNIYPLCLNIIKIINDEVFHKNEQLIKIEGIKLIGILSGFIQEEDWKSDDKKLIIFYLKRYFLTDKKRKVRHAAGIVLNLLCCTKPKISFLNE